MKTLIRGLGTAIVLMAAMQFASAQELSSGGETGNGGDELRVLFTEAREFAAERVLSLSSCSFSSETRPEIKEWILQNKAELAQDIVSSPHTWVTDQQATCAWTQPNRNHEITLSFVACDVDRQEMAAEILVHESVHHFNITSQSFADEVARAVFRASTATSCAVVDPFDPESCMGTRLTQQELGKLLVPGTDHGRLGSYQAHLRERTCNSFTCSEWGMGPLRTLDLWRGDGKVATSLPGQGVIDLMLVYGRVNLKLFDENTQCGGEIKKCDLGAMPWPRYRIYDGYPATGSFVPMFMDVIVTNKCARLSVNIKHKPLASGVWVERDYVIMSQY